MGRLRRAVNHNYHTNCSIGTLFLGAIGLTFLFFLSIYLFVKYIIFGVLLII